MMKTKKAKTLFVCTHATEGSTSAAMMQALIVQWKDEKSPYLLTNLHDINFNPLAGRDDFKTLPAGAFNFRQEQKRAYLHANFSEDIASEHEKINAAETLIIIFPMWFFGMPAIMKGWFERVLTKGYAYGSGKEYKTGGMAGKTVYCIVTAAGSEADYSAEGKHIAMQNILDVIVKLPLSYCGFIYAGNSVIYDVESLCEQRLAERCATAAQEAYAMITRS